LTSRSLLKKGAYFWGVRKEKGGNEESRSSQGHRKGTARRLRERRGGEKGMKVTSITRA